ncbi:uncharacterized protein DMAD_07662 [Drosophila madeirensis]|uniref:Uncharacterized protein n=1 Tax=Drosophila madeirensis TaxID=30013 RepID=A0AAU9EP21_DROMD
MAEEPNFETAAPIEQRDLPTLQEALQTNPAAGPRPLTIAEYRARQEKKAIPKHKRSEPRVKLLQQRRLVKEMNQFPKNESDRQRYIDRLQNLDEKLRNGAKQRKRAA